MAQTIKLKRSSVSGNTPSTSDLELGEVAINTYDGKMFIKKNDGSDSIVEIGGSSGTVTDAFKTIAVSGQTSVVADSATDTLTFVAGTNMSITTNASGDAITFASTGSSGSATFLGLSDTPANFTGAAGKFLKVNSGGNSIEFDTLNFDDLGTTPTTLAGYGITDSLQLGTSSTTALAGNTSIPSALTDLSISDGSNGQVLQTDGSGNFSFVNQTGGNSFGTIAVSGQSDVVADQGSDTLTLVAGNNITLSTNASGDSVTITSTASGSGPTAADAILEEYQFTATSGQTTFTGSDDNSQTLSYTANAIQVFLNGIFLDPSVDYTATNGTSIVLSETVDANDYLQIIAYKKKISDGQTTVNTFTGNGSTTAFTLSLNPGDENNTRVFVDGVYQSKSNYSVSGTTLTFTTAPSNGTAIEVEVGNRIVTLDTLSNLDLPDNVKLRLGTSQDLEIFHDGNNSRITDTGTGDLIIKGGNDILFQDAVGNTLANMNQSNSVELYFGGNKKFETTSAGVDVTGIIKASGNGKLQIADDVEGSTFEFNVGGTGALEIYDGTTERFRIDSSGNVGIGTTTPSSFSGDGNNLVVGTTSGNNGISVISATDGTSNIYFGDTTTTGGGSRRGQIVYDHNTDSMRFATAVTERMRIDSSGNVGIRNTNPNKPLTITADSGANGIALRARSADDYSFIQFFNNAGTALRGQIYSKAAGDIGFTTGTDSSAGNDLYIKNGTGVGIGTTSPVGTLDVSSTNAVGSVFRKDFNGPVADTFSKVAVTLWGQDHDDADVGTGTDQFGPMLGFGARIDDGSPNSGDVRAGISYSYNGDLTFHAKAGASVADGSYERIRIDGATGNVGIGTASPDAPLAVHNSSLTSTSFDGSGGIRVHRPNAFGQYGWLEYGYNSDTTFIGSKYSGGTATHYGQIWFAQDSNGGSRRYPLVITGASNVGIGTTNPSTRLHVDSGSDFPAITIARSTTNAGLSFTLGMSDFGGGGTDLLFDGVGNNTGFGFRSTNASGTQVNSLVIAPSGNVGIGTTSPANKLHVKAGASGATTFDSRNNIILEDDGENYLGFYTPNNSFSGLRFVNADSSIRAHIDYYHGTQGDKFVMYSQEGWEFTYPSYGVQQVLKKNGNVGIRATNPPHDLTIYNASGPTLYLVGGGYNDDVRIAFGGGDTTNTSSDGNTGAQIISTQSALNGQARGDLRFLTNQGDSLQTRLVIEEAGNVGIGTTSPGYPLEISGPGTVSLAYQRTGTGVTAKKWGFHSDNSNTYWQNITDSILAITVANAGNVGIGTTSPQVNLDIAGTLASPPTIRLTNTTTGFTAGDSTGEIEFYHSDPTDFTPGVMAKIRAVAGASGGEGSLQILTNMPSEGADAATIAAHFNGNGNVGIGTTSPGSTLDVHGNTNLGSDYIGNQYTTTLSGFSVTSNGSDYYGSYGTLLLNSNQNYTSNSRPYMITNALGASKFAIISGTNATTDPTIGTSGNITSGSARLVIDNAGNVGIGDTLRTGVSATTTLTTKGSIVSGYSQGASTNVARNTRDWFVYAGPSSSNSGVYVHMKTNLWGGGSAYGNSEFTMSSFTYHNYYAYGGTWARGQISWHNWSNSFYNVVRQNEGTLELVQPSYMSSDGYVVLVAKIDAAYAQFSIDWFQWGGYSFRDRKVTAVTQHSAATGAY